MCSEKTDTVQNGEHETSNVWHESFKSNMNSFIDQFAFKTSYLDSQTGMILFLFPNINLCVDRKIRRAE